MTDPRTAAIRFAWACFVGLQLGLLYGFLRPLGAAHRHLADGIFVAGMLAGWLFWAFDICRADMRPVGLFGMALGGILWENTAGRLLRPIFHRFWRIIGKMWDFLLLPGKKILKMVKILFASGEKWVTIG